MKPTTSSIVSIVLLLGMASPCVAAQIERPVTEPNITAEMRHDDPRLAQRVTVWHQRIRVGELLQEISSTTHVSITAGDRDGAEDPHVAVFFRDVPLSTALNAVWSLMSYRTALWRWDRYGSAGAYTYRLVVPQNARGLRDRLNAWVQQQFEANAAKLMAACDGTDAERRAALKDLYGDPDQLGTTQTAERLWVDIRAFKHALTPEQQKQVLRGETEIDVPMSALDPASRQRVMADWHEYADTPVYSLVAGRMVEQPPRPEPTGVHFHLVGYLNTPSLCLDMIASTSEAPYEIGGIPLERDYRARIRGLWMLDADSAEDAAMDRPMSHPSDEAELTPTGPRPPASTDPNGQPTILAIDHLVKRLEDVAAASGVALLARLPEEEAHVSLSEPWGKTLREYWKQLWNQALMVKWRDGVLLASTDSWPRQEPPVPLRVIRALRRDAKPGELLPWQDLLDVADSLTPKQIARLAPEFPVMRAVAGAQGILHLFSRYPDLARKAQAPPGLPISPQVAVALRPFLPAQLMAFIKSGEARFLSLKLTEEHNPGEAYRQVIFLLRSQDGKALQGIGFRQEPQPLTQPQREN